MRKGILFCIIGPAGGGKTSIGDKLLSDNDGHLSQSVSVTSRAMRLGEENGKSYTFITRAEFEAKIKADYFFEWEEVHGNLYGTPRENLENAVSAGRDLLLIIDIRGALNVKKSFSADCVIVTILPPSFDALVERIKSRGAVSESELSSRMATARSEYEKIRELSASGEYLDYLVINGELKAAAEQVRCILRSERLRMRRLNPSSIHSLCEVR
ncbi:MAG: guanylate kinase [Deltaproteobacteria bacterium]|nr:guanylate kinase [Deltaproteobacteria bacterium]